MIGNIRAAAPYGPAVGTEHAEGFAARLAGERGISVVRCKRARMQWLRVDRHVTSRGVPFEGGSDVATRWNPADEGFASVPGPSPGSLARPVDGRASRGSGSARFVPDGSS